MAALALLSFATGGASVICQLGGEAENPGRDIPLVMIISTVLVGIMYVLVALVAVGVFPIDKVADQNLTIVAFEVLPRPVYYVFVIGAALGATSSTLNAQLSWVTKPLIVACEDGLLPEIPGNCHGARRGMEDTDGFLCTGHGTHTDWF